MGNINWLTLIANIYHWDNRVDNEIIVSIDKKINDWVRQQIKRMNGEK